MALARTNQVGSAAASGSPGTAAYTTAAFTPPDNSLLVVGHHAMQESASTSILTSMTIADSTSRTWTERVTGEGLNAYSFGVKIWTAPIVTGVSMTVSVDCGAIDLFNAGVAVVAYTGYDVATPTGGTGSYSDLASPDGAQSITLSAAPATGDEVVGFSSFDKESIGCTPGATFSEQYDVQVGALCGFELETRTGSTSTTVDWVDTHTGTGDIFKAVGVALVIKAAAAAGAALPIIVMPPRRA